MENKDDQSESFPTAELFSVILNCSGSSSDVVESTLFKDLSATLKHQTYSLPNDVEIFNFSFDDDFPVSVLIKMARTNIHKLSTSTIDSFGSRANTTTFFTVRESVTKLLLILRCNYQDLR